MESSQYIKPVLLLKEAEIETQVGYLAEIIKIKYAGSTYSFRRSDQLA